MAAESVNKSTSKDAAQGASHPEAGKTDAKVADVKAAKRAEGKTTKKADAKKAESAAKPERKGVKSKAAVHTKLLNEEGRKAKAAVQSGAWAPYVFVPMAVIGMLWMVVFYIAGNDIGFMAALGNWNYLVGIGLIAGSFIVATQWK